MANNIHYTFDFVDKENIEKNKLKLDLKLIEVEAADPVEAKEKILKLLMKLNSKIITVRPVTKEDRNEY
tara:strand:- start:60 stop:266 length:207 start_codon:yes stop_codon:yes gene_type:complete